MAHHFKMLKKHVFCQTQHNTSTFFIVTSYQRPNVMEFEIIESWITNSMKVNDIEKLNLK